MLHLFKIFCRKSWLQNNEEGEPSSGGGRRRSCRLYSFLEFAIVSSSHGNSNDYALLWQCFCYQRLKTIGPDERGGVSDLPSVLMPVQVLMFHKVLEKFFNSHHCNVKNFQSSSKCSYSLPFFGFSIYFVIFDLLTLKAVLFKKN